MDVLRRADQQAIRFAQALPQVRHGRRQGLRIPLRAVVGQVIQALPASDLQLGGRQARRLVQQQRVEGLGPEASGQGEDAHRLNPSGAR